MKEFRAGTVIVWFVELLGWIILLGGVSGAVWVGWRVAVYSADGARTEVLIVAVLFGVGSVVAGALLIVVAQLARAQIVTAINTTRLVDLAEAAQKKTVQVNAPPPVAAPDRLARHSHNGVPFFVTKEGGYRVGSKDFASEDEARAYIEAGESG